MDEAMIKRVDEIDETIGDFIHQEFSLYGEQQDVILNYDEFCFIAQTEDGTIIGAITGRAYYTTLNLILYKRQKLWYNGIGDER